MCDSQKVKHCERMGNEKENATKENVGKHAHYVHYKKWERKSIKQEKPLDELLSRPNVDP